MDLAHEKRINLYGIEFGIAIAPARAEQIRRSAVLRSLARPTRRMIRAVRSRGAPAARTADPTDDARKTLAPPPVPETPEARAVLDRIAGIDWYHVIELPHGVVTPGCVDHRAQLHLYGLPPDMRGMRVLEVATFDGFFSFEMERRGAEVIAIDLDSWLQIDLPRTVRDHIVSVDGDRPMGAGFRAAHELLGSRVERRAMSVYGLTPDTIGTFDYAFISDVLIHLRDPLAGLEAIFSVLRPGGSLTVAEPYAPELERQAGALGRFESFDGGVWWRTSSKALTALMQLAGFDPIREVSRFRLAATWDRPVEKVVLKGYRRS